MTPLVAYLLLFVAVGAGFIFVHLVIGKLIRPNKPGTEKRTIYECGEPTIGSAWVQFDLRFYVVALLFVIFDVEMAFFFPWAVVFGQSMRAADHAATASIRDASYDLAWVAFGDILFFFGVGFFVANLWAILDLVRYQVRRRSALLLWENPKPPYYGFTLALGAVKGQVGRADDFFGVGA